MRKPEEIKKGLECCISDTYGCNEKCPYFNSLSNGVDCAVKMHADALAYIQQLEAKVTNLERVRATQATSVTTMQDALFKQQLHQSRLLEERSQLEARVPRWIPVEERLPEAGVDVALVIRCGDVSCVRSGWWTSGHMSGFICPWDQSLDGFNVTHWMPLPEPPEEVHHEP